MLATSLVALVVIGVLIVAIRRRTRRGPARAPRRRGPGAGAAGAVYELLNEDRRRALELIVDERAEATDPETADDKPE